jgi:Zn-dependent peptidase ImmA (M78 family)
MSKKAKAAAREILDRFGSKIPIKIDAIVKAHDIEIFEDNELESFVSGILMMKAGRVGLVINHYHSESRKRFTIAHELGHYLLHRDTSSVFIDETPLFYRGARSERDVDTREVEANVFAAELLMPEEAVRADLKAAPARAKDSVAIGKMATRYGVSGTAMQYRLQQLKLVAE